MKQNTSWGMFSAAGDTAVDHIVQTCVKNHQTRERAYHETVEQLRALCEVKCFAEATDTDVRERIWKHMCEQFPTPVFKTTRK